MFLRNAWYMAAWAEEVRQKPLRRILLEEPVVMFRKSSGQAVALVDRCPHRFAPLSLGKVQGDTLECGYHGLRFDASGACVHNPHGDGKIPNKTCVYAYPIVEKNTLIWIWMGDPASVDLSTIPSYSFLDDDSRSRVDGYLNVKANYQLEIDNLLDLSHTQFVHDNFHYSESIISGQHEVKHEGKTVDSKLWCPSGPPSNNFSKRLPSLPAGEKVDQWFDMRWEAPSTLRLDTGVTVAGEPRENGARSFTAHVLTPETATSTHYFFAHSRDFLIGDKTTDESIALWQRVGFGEQDRGILEAVQKTMQTTDLMSLNPVLLPIDAAAIRARRVLDSLIEAERKSGFSQPPATHALVKNS